MSAWAKYAAKFLTALAGAVALAVTQGLLTGTAAKWVGVAIAFVTAIGVGAVPNLPVAPTPAPASAAPSAPAPVPPAAEAPPAPAK